MEHMIYIPAINRFMLCAEGTGDNLLREDIAEGFVDYYLTTLYRMEGGELEEEDGGQWMLEKPFDEVFSERDEFIWACLENQLGISRICAPAWHVVE